MLLNITLGLLIIGITVSIHGYGSKVWISHLTKYNRTFKKVGFIKNPEKILISTALFLLLLNFFEAFIWGVLYYSHPGITEFETLEKAIYFSLVTFTSLGYGEITISSSHRIIAGFEAMNGILLLGWSTTMMFSVMQFIWKGTINKK